ncbi:protein windbeutel [Danaus plexippus]|nr:protein windbeutel [Danaus plexippus]
MMSGLIFLACIILVVPSTYQESLGGLVELDEVSFNKLVPKFDATVVKFDVAYPYGDKHDTYVALSKESKDVDNLLFAQVGVKDYGEKDNEAFAKKYGADKNNFPVVKLFLKDKSKPITFDDSEEFTIDRLRQFVREQSGIYLSLPGCIRSLDLLAIKFKNSDTDKRKSIAKETEKVLENLSKEVAGNGKIYKTIMEKILEKGDDFIQTEITRVNKLLAGKISNEKKNELSQRINILKSFLLPLKNYKEEL